MAAGAEAAVVVAVLEVEAGHLVTVLLLCTDAVDMEHLRICLAAGMSTNQSFSISANDRSTGIAEAIADVDGATIRIEPSLHQRHNLYVLYSFITRRVYVLRAFLLSRRISWWTVGWLLRKEWNRWRKIKD